MHVPCTIDTEGNLAIDNIDYVTGIGNSSHES